MAAKASVAIRPVSAEPLIKSFERALKAENKRQPTIDHYLGAARQFVAFCEAEGLPALDNVTREHIEMWLERLHRDYAPYSVKNRFVGLRIFFKWLKQEDEIQTDPTLRIRMPRVDEVEKDVVSQGDMQKLFQQLEKQKRWRDCALVAILYDTGMRATEIADLETERVNLDTGIIFISKTKNHRTRVAKLSAAGLRYLDRYLRRDERKDKTYLLNGSRGKLTRSGIYQIVREACEEVGIKATIGPHDLRHTSATHVAAEMSERDMMTLYGWTDPEMARHCARGALEQAALSAHDKASPLARLMNGRAK